MDRRTFLQILGGILATPLIPSFLRGWKKWEPCCHCGKVPRKEECFVFSTGHRFCDPCMDAGYYDATACPRKARDGDLVDYVKIHGCHPHPDEYHYGDSA